MLVLFRSASGLDSPLLDAGGEARSFASQADLNQVGSLNFGSFLPLPCEGWNYKHVPPSSV